MFRLRYLMVICASFLLVAGFAANDFTPAEAQNLPAKAEVYISNAKIESQIGHTFTLSFDLVNGKGLAPGVQYAVQLVHKGKQGSQFADQYVYPEVLSLGESSSVHKTIVYKAPEMLSGEYDLWLASQNESGQPFSFVGLDAVILSESGKGVSIVPGSCFLQVKNEKNAPHYTLGQGVDILKTEQLIATCGILNSSKEALTVTPKFETRYRTVFGDAVDQEEISTPLVLLKAGETKNVSLQVPQALVPQAYDTVLTYFLNGKSVSNSVTFHYVLRGESATIQQATLDKDFYKAGETARISVLVTASADSFPESRFGTSTLLSSPIVEASITNGLTEQTCSPLISKALESDSLSFDVKIESECMNPTLSVAIKSANGLLAQKDFLIATSPDRLEKTATGKKTLAAVSVLLIFLVLAALLAWKKKKSAMVLFIILTVSVGLTFANTAWGEMVTFKMEFNYATTDYVYIGNGNSVPRLNYHPFDFNVVGNLNKSTYAPGENITIFGRSSSNPSVCSNHIKAQMDASEPTASSSAKFYQTYPNNVIQNDWTGSGQVTAPQKAGQYYIHVKVGIYPNLTHAVDSNNTDGNRFGGADDYTKYMILSFFVVDTPSVAANQPPTPPVIGVPSPAYIDIKYPITFTSTDPENDHINYVIDWEGDGTLDKILPERGSFVSTAPQNIGTVNQEYFTRGLKTIKAQTKDSKNASSVWTTQTFTVSNRPPSAPVITDLSSNSKKPKESQSFTFKSTDLDNDNMTYIVNWGDGTAQTTSGVKRPNETFSVVHTYTNPGTYTITAKAKDNYAADPKESALSNKTIVITSGTEVPPVTIVTTAPLSATCSVDTNSVTAPAKITWTATGRDGTPPYTYAWNGGSYATSNTFEKTFPTASTGYAPSLDIKDAKGDTLINGACPVAVVKEAACVTNCGGGISGGGGPIPTPIRVVPPTVPPTIITPTNPQSALCYPTKNGIDKTTLARVGEKIIWISKVTPDPRNPAGKTPVYKYLWSAGLTGTSASITVAKYGTVGKYMPHLKVTGDTTFVEADCSVLIVINPGFEEF